MENRVIDLPDGNKLNIQFTDEGIVYDIYDNKMEKVIKEVGYDFYYEITPLKPQLK